ncbi:unnamed protein product, partial [Amoebophrya sp. A120]
QQPKKVLLLYEKFVDMVLQTYEIVRVHSEVNAGDEIDTFGIEDPLRGAGDNRDNLNASALDEERAPRVVLDAESHDKTTSSRGPVRVSGVVSSTRRASSPSLTKTTGNRTKTREQLVRQEYRRHHGKAPPLLEDELVAQKFLAEIDRLLYESSSLADAAEDEIVGDSDHVDEDEILSTSDKDDDEYYDNGLTSPGQQKKDEHGRFLRNEEFDFTSPLRKSQIAKAGNLNDYATRDSSPVSPHEERVTKANRAKNVLKRMKIRTEKAQRNVERVAMLRNVEDTRRLVRRLLFHVRALELKRSILLMDPPEEIALR